MLSNIIVKSLYGLYSYTIDFRPERKTYCFVTGPNAYGKTSLLRMINALYNQDFNDLAKVRFDEFILTFDDNYKIKVTQKRIYDQDSDDTFPLRVLLRFVLYNSQTQIGVEVFEWDSETESTDALNNLTAYLASHPVYLITDNRLYKGGAGEPIGRIIESGMKKYLENIELKLNSALQRGLVENQPAISANDYNERLENLRPLIESSKRYGLIEKNLIPSYSIEESAFCHRCIVAAEQAYSGEIVEVIKKLDSFCSIIEEYGFAKKELELSPYFGIRFRADDEMGSLLLYDQLSSGEKHILLMNYDILIEVPDDALVLIDEPELSFHLEWQGRFLSNLEKIVRVRHDLQFIMCTHSPEMFGYEWSLSTDLYEQAEKHDI